MTALDTVLPALRCPVCGNTLVRDDRRVVCADGHAFDLARQGYVNLAVGAHAGTGDTPAMVDARVRFLGRGHYDAVGAAVRDALPVRADGDDGGLFVDLAGGTGHHLAAVLDGHPTATGLCLDLSTPALRRAARAHPRLAAVGTDVWRRLPLADAAATAVLSVFGPRTPDEVARVLRPDGVAVLVTPTADHLRELVEPLGMLRVDPRKGQRLAAAFADFTVRSDDRLTYGLTLDRDDAVAAAAMGPTGAHAGDDELRQRAAALPETVGVTVSVRLLVLTPKKDGR